MFRRPDNSLYALRFHSSMSGGDWSGRGKGESERT